ncbi:thioredoxin [Oscillospiraceae bacterium OttesenSCG-928-G22]|nr:thioredoxin [Oscillospiraceae bacterium OttesenSCG-928-G22]
MSDKIVTLTAENFETEALRSEKPVLVDFWAEWCGPCRMMAPIFSELADECGDKITFAKLNIDDEGELAVRYQVMSIPTLLLFKDGKEAERIVGVQPKEQLLGALSKYL